MGLSSVLAETRHRPYPLPGGSWLLTQWWRDLLFAHWKLPPESLEPFLPPSLEPDTFDGNAYVGIVPFRMTGVRPRFLPAIPGTEQFLELNLRTYVRPRNRPDQPPGVFFWTLEASSPLAVWGARTFFHLPYRHSHMQMEEAQGWIHYRSERTHRGETAALFEARYRPRNRNVALGASPQLTDWLSERYCLYTTNPRQELFRGDIHHVRWPLEPAEIEINENTLAIASGIALPAEPPILHFARELEVAIWPLRKLD